MTVKTLCKNCIFSQYTEQDDDFVQIGCTVDRVEKFSNIGVIALQEYDKETKRLYFAIPRLCNLCRQPGWLKQGESREEAKKRARAEVKFKCEVLIPLQEGKDWGPLLLRNTIRSLKQQELLPTKIVIIRNVSNPSLHFLLNLLRDELDVVEGLDWSLRDILDRNEDGTFLEEGAALDIQVKDTKTVWYAVVPVGIALAKNFFSDIDVAINDELRQFSGLRNNDVYVMSTFLHKELGGNEESEFVEARPTIEESEAAKGIMIKGVLNKAIFISTKLNDNHMMVPLEDIVHG